MSTWFMDDPFWWSILLLFLSLYICTHFYGLTLAEDQISLVFDNDVKQDMPKLACDTLKYVKELHIKTNYL